MKIWYPIQYEPDDYTGVQDYIQQCTVDGNVLKAILKNGMNNTRFTALQSKLDKCEAIHYTTEQRRSPITIANMYINSLQCFYDFGSYMCYYAVPDIVRCPNTTDSLNYVIRLIEYGNDEIPPMNWIRHSYEQFKEKIMELHRDEC